MKSGVRVRHEKRNDLIDISGQRFGRYVALRLAPPQSSGAGHRYPSCWICRCDCGAIRYVLSIALRTGKSNGCRDCAAAAKRVPDEQRFCQWCKRSTGDSGKPRECGACERRALRNGRDADGRPVARGKLFVGTLRAVRAEPVRQATRPADLVAGSVVGGWTLLRRGGTDRSGKNARWVALCECGTERAVLATKLRTGRSASCGCRTRLAPRPVAVSDAKPKDTRHDCLGVQCKDKAEFQSAYCSDPECFGSHRRAMKSRPQVLVSEQDVLGPFNEERAL
jgi:hypothetical protein